MRLFHKNVEMVVVFVLLGHFWVQNGHFDGKMPITILVFGLVLLVTWSPILGVHFGPWDALILQKCGNGSGFCQPRT